MEGAPGRWRRRFPPDCGGSTPWPPPSLPTGHPLPRDEEALELARRRLTFEELFCLACGMALLRTRRTCAEGVPFHTAGGGIPGAAPLLPHGRPRRPWRRWRSTPPPARP
ncbi:MAG: hypothetical protein ACLRIS_08890 [Flavonifractor plautii]